jgi:hypothetical protein
VLVENVKCKVTDLSRCMVTIRQDGTI